MRTGIADAKDFHLSHVFCNSILGAFQKCGRSFASWGERAQEWRMPRAAEREREGTSVWKLQFQSQPRFFLPVASSGVAADDLQREGSVCPQA